jgi:hypothetical protein
MKLAVLLGAGATLSDVATRPLKERPPLDRGFFRVAKVANPSVTANVTSYMTKVYESDILAPTEDSLERVMGQIYTDTFNPGLKKDATEAFRALLRLFTRRIASTTNDIEPTNKRWLYRIVASYLAAGVEPGDITIVTYNQDLQVEKSLCLMAETARWERFAEQIFNFPGCYALGDRDVTEPGGVAASELFPEHDAVDGCIRVLKLHGSLNWYSSHTSPKPSQTAMFNPSRLISITRRRIIPTDMMISGTRSTHALPVLVPPVTHKSSVLHDDLREVWRLAEEVLDRADELVVFGYSCPPLDFESANQLRRSQLRKQSQVSVIDPDGQIAARYIDLLKPTRLSYFSSAKSFLAAS